MRENPSIFGRESLGTNIENSGEAPPSEAYIFDTFTQICGDASYTEANREQVGGKLKLIEVFMDKPNEAGNRVKLDYSVSPLGVASMDVAYFDPAKGYDFRPGRGYSKEDIVPGKALGDFKNGVLNG